MLIFCSKHSAEKSLVSKYVTDHISYYLNILFDNQRVKLLTIQSLNEGADDIGMKTDLSLHKEHCAGAMFVVSRKENKC